MQNNKGYTIPELLVVVMLSSIVALFISAVFVNMQKNQIKWFSKEMHTLRYQGAYDRLNRLFASVTHIEIGKNNEVTIFDNSREKHSIQIKNDSLYYDSTSLMKNLSCNKFTFSLKDGGNDSNTVTSIIIADWKRQQYGNFNYHRRF